jgi:hypothetical protein
MTSSRLQPNQQLNRAQVFETFNALGYPLESIISTVDYEDFAGSEIFRPTALSAALQVVMRKARDQNDQLILFRVCSESRQFMDDQEGNDHYVALHFFQDGTNLKVTYIDPTGAEISQQVRGVIASNLSLAGCTIVSSRASLQFTNSIQGCGIPYRSGGKTLDCGVLIALASDMVRGNYEARNQIKLHEASSSQLRQVLKQLANGEKALAEVRKVIDGILRSNVPGGGEGQARYHNSLLELDVLERLRAEFDATEKQQAEVAKRIIEFGSKKLADTSVTKPHLNPKRPGQTITFTVSGIKSEILDILCLAQLLFEGGNEDVAYEIRVQILQLGIGAKKNGIAHPQNLEYLEKCLAGFKPAIYKTLKEFFAEKFGVSQYDVLCLPKATGQQFGAKIVVRDTRNPENPRVFHAKSHQEFCSKSDPIYGMQTSNGLGLADLKELFMYKVLEKIGYGPKAEFLVDGDLAQTGVGEGIMIITQDSSYTKRSSLEQKSFKTFGEIKNEIASTPSEAIAVETKRDIITIDVLSRVFLLEDIMVNDGNFGIVEVSQKGSEETKSKWKIVDFMPPKSLKGKEHLGDRKYAYTHHYGGSTVTHGFISGNFSHTYAEDSPVNKILSEKKSKKLCVSAVASLEDGKSERKTGIEIAANDSYDEIMHFLRKNEECLRLKEADGSIKPLTTRRIHDLAAYRDCTLGNFKELYNGLKELSKDPILNE